MNDVPQTIRCRVAKKSRYARQGDRVFKSISLDPVPGRYFGLGDENSGDFEYSTINLSISDEVPCFFDGFEVNQLVELEIRAVPRN